MLIVASGSGAAMPHMAIVERGYKGKIYQTHAAATRDLMRVGGKAVEGAFVVSGPAVIAEQLPDSHPSKKVAIDFVQKYEKGVRPRHAQPVRRPCLRRADRAGEDPARGAEEGQARHQGVPRGAEGGIETMGRTIFSHGVMNWTKDDHWGFTNETGVMLKVVNGDLKVE